MLGALGKIGVVGNGIPLPRRVRNILSKYSASMLIPGASGVAVHSFAPGNFIESTGHTLTPVDGAVGLAVDAAGSVGPELAPSTSSTTGWAQRNANTAPLSVTADSLRVQNAGVGTTDTAIGASTVMHLVQNKVYEVSGFVKKLTGDYAHIAVINNAGTAFIIHGKQVTSSEYERVSVVFAATETNSQLYLRAFLASGTTTAGGISAEFKNISVRERPGIHATQPTAQNKPVLCNTDGIQYWQLDGTDDRWSLSAVPFQMSDDHFVVAGCTRGATGTTRRIFHVGSGGDTQRVANLSIASTGVAEVAYRSDSGPFVVVAGTSVLPEAPVVLSATSIASAIKLRVDSLIAATGTNPGGATTLTAAAIGAHTAGGSYFNGHIHGVIFGKGAITDAELLTLEKFVAKLQGRTL